MMFNLCRSVVPINTHRPTSSLLNSHLARPVYPRIMLPTVISVSVYIPLHNTPIPSPLLSLFCCYFCCGPSRTHFYPLLLILLTWIWATCFLHSAGLRAFVRLYNDASPILYFPFPPCFVSRHENKICDMCAPMCIICCRSSLTAHTDPSHRSLARVRRNGACGRTFVVIEELELLPSLC